MAFEGHPLTRTWDRSLAAAVTVTVGTASRPASSWTPAPRSGPSPVPFFAYVCVEETSNFQVV